MTTPARQLDLFDGIIPPDTPLGNYQCCQGPPPLPPPPADPLDHHKRFGVTADEHVAALEWLSDNDETFANLEDRLCDLEEIGDTTGAAVVQEQLDRIVADYLRSVRQFEPKTPLLDATKATEATEAPEVAQATEPEPVQPPRLKWNQLAQGRKALVPDLEKHLREKGWPYVAVDDAKKAIFASGSIKAFDYLIYSSNGPNLLVLVITRRPAAEQVQQMQEWQKVFGTDFQAVFMFRTGGEWRLVSLQDLQSPDPLAHARSLEDSVN